MTILGGSLHCHDGSGSLYVPDKRDVAGGWGESWTAHGGGEKPLPNRLTITFFSYLEDQFYRGDFDLPHERILALFREGYFSPKRKRHTRFDEILVGVAPDGVAAVWLRGPDRTVEVFYGQAQKTELSWSALTGATHLTREQYVRRRIEEFVKDPQEREALRKNGPPLGRWDRYRVRYAWQPVFVDMPLLDERIDLILHFNGEHEHMPFPLSAAAVAAPRPVPNEIY